MGSYEFVKLWIPEPNPDVPPCDYQMTSTNDSRWFTCGMPTVLVTVISKNMYRFRCGDHHLRGKYPFTLTPDEYLVWEVLEA